MADDGIKITAHGLFLTSSAEVDRLTTRAFRQISSRIDGEMHKMRDRIRKQLHPPKSKGRQYPSRRPGSRKMHTASLPGYPPNMDTGILRQSIRVTGSLKRGDKALEAAVLPPLVDYAMVLEHGSKHIEPRPFFYVTIDKMLKTGRFQKVMRAVSSAILNDLAGDRGIRRHKKWKVVK